MDIDTSTTEFGTPMMDTTPRAWLFSTITFIEGDDALRSFPDELLHQLTSYCVRNDSPKLPWARSHCGNHNVVASYQGGRNTQFVDAEKRAQLYAARFRYDDKQLIIVRAKNSSTEGAFNNGHAAIILHDPTFKVGNHASSEHTTWGWKIWTPDGIQESTSVLKLIKKTVNEGQDNRIGMDDLRLLGGRGGRGPPVDNMVGVNNLEMLGGSDASSAQKVGADDLRRLGGRKSHTRARDKNALSQSSTTPWRQRENGSSKDDGHQELASKDIRMQSETTSTPWSRNTVRLTLQGRDSSESSAANDDESNLQRTSSITSMRTAHEADSPPTIRSTSLPSMHDMSTIICTFKKFDRDPNPRQRLLSECNSASRLFANARVAGIANKNTLILLVYIGNGAPRMIMCDDEQDYQDLVREVDRRAAGGDVHLTIMSEDT